MRWPAADLDLHHTAAAMPATKKSHASFYEILGVEKSATEQEIKKAYVFLFVLQAKH